MEGILSRLSPSYRNKRIPSAQDNYSCSSNQNLKISKTESPSKFSQEIRRRKSHYQQGNHAACKRKEHPQSTQNIINSIQYLKEEYQKLKEAYRELIKEKIKNTTQINTMRSDNSRLKTDYERISREKESCQNVISELRNQLECAKVAFQTALDEQKAKTRALQSRLAVRDRLCDGKPSHMLDIVCTKQCTNQQNNQSLMLSQDKVLTNQNQYLSFSLTSMLEESTYNQDLNTKRRKEHLKQLSDLSIHSREEQKVVEPKSNRNKDQSYHFKKFRKEIVDRLEINLDQKPSMLNLNPMKTPIGGDRKVNLNKTKNSKSKRKDEDKENADVKHSKKKSKKISQVHQE